MRLFIAEKPSLGRTIADALPVQNQQRDRYKIVAGDDIVCWSAGHILQLFNPAEYDDKYKFWSVSNLPIVPEIWKNKPTEATKDLLKNIGELLKKADIVINAGDADREGQLLIDEIISYHKYKGKVLRLLVTDPTIAGVKKALADMQPNEKYKGLRLAAEARQRADWLFGVSLTRLFTVTTERSRGDIVSVGRVQTPTLALVVKRDLEIENFQPHPFFGVKGLCVVKSGEFHATWKPKDDQPGLDEEGRIVDKNVIDALRKKLTGKIGAITKYEKKKSQTQPSLPHCLSTLQVEASNRYGYSPADTLKHLQTLYEAKLATYPRSDCQYLPENLYSERNQILAGIFTLFLDLSALKSDLDPNLKSKTWDDKKVEEHYAIIPTGQLPTSPLSEEQLNILRLIALRYAAQFFPPQTFDVVSVNVEINNELFKAQTKACTSVGWKALYKSIPEEDTKEEADKDDELASEIPETYQGEPTAIREYKIDEKKTTPPKRFTEGSLIDAMTHIYRYVENPDIKAALKETEGIGTAATRATMIEKLKERNYIKPENKNIVSTDKGRLIIKDAPDELTKPDTTAYWESRYKEIQSMQLTQSDFQDNLVKLTQKIIKDRMSGHQELRPKDVAAKAAAAEEKKYHCPKCVGSMSKIITKTSTFWACSGCGFTLFDEKGRPQKTSKCPVCGGMAVRIKGKNGFFWACRNQECKKTFSDEKGKLTRKG